VKFENVRELWEATEDVTFGEGPEIECNLSGALRGKFGILRMLKDEMYEAEVQKFARSCVVMAEFSLPASTQ
jgi:hypothetical protein